MENIGLFWGSTTGNQEDAAKFLIDYMTSEGFKIDSHDIRSTNPNEMLNYKKLIIGCPTWNVGELQEDWEKVYEEYKKLDFTGIKAAFFGCGDQVGYSDNFLDAIGLLAKPFISECRSKGLPKEGVTLQPMSKGSRFELSFTKSSTVFNRT